MKLKRIFIFLVLLFFARNPHAQKGAIDLIGDSYRSSRLAEVSIEGDRSTYELAEALAHEAKLTDSAHNIGVKHLTLSRFDSALFYFKISHEIKKLKKDKEGEVTSLQFLGKTCLEMGKTNVGLGYLQHALALSKKILAKNQELESYRLLVEAYEKLEKPGLAYQYLKSYTVLKDSLVKVDIPQKLTNDQATLILQQKDDALIRKTQEIRTIYVMSIIGTFFALAVLLWLFYSKLSQQYSLNDELKQKNLLIEQQAQQMEAFLEVQSVRQKKSNKAGGIQITNNVE